MKAFFNLVRLINMSKTQPFLVIKKHIYNLNNIFVMKFFLAALQILEQKVTFKLTHIFSYNLVIVTWVLNSVESDINFFKFVQIIL